MWALLFSHGTQRSQHLHLQTVFTLWKAYSIIIWVDKDRISVMDIEFFIDPQVFKSFSCSLNLSHLPNFPHSLHVWGMMYEHKRTEMRQKDIVWTWASSLQLGKGEWFLWTKPALGKFLRLERWLRIQLSGKYHLVYFRMVDIPLNTKEKGWRYGREEWSKIGSKGINLVESPQKSKFLGLPAKRPSSPSPGVDWFHGPQFALH